MENEEETMDKELRAYIDSIAVESVADSNDTQAHRYAKNCVQSVNDDSAPLKLDSSYVSPYARTR